MVHRRGFRYRPPAAVSFSEPFTTSLALTWSAVNGGTLSVAAGGTQGTSNGSFVQYLYRAQHDVGTTDMYAEITQAANYSGTGLGVCTRLSASATTYYCFDVDGSGGSYLFQRVVAGSATDISSGRVTITASSTPRTIRLESQGSAHRLYINGSLINTYTDSTITTGQRGGIAPYNSNGTMRFDDFSVGALGGGGGSVTPISFTATPQAGQVTCQWSTTRTDITGWLIGRNGTDTAGTGPWSTELPTATTSIVFDKLVASTSYTFTLTPHTATGDLTPLTASATPTSGTVDPPPVTTGNWLSGSSMDDRDTMGAWRGRTVEITAMWSDSDASNQINMWPIQPGVGDLTGWTAAMDVAIGAIFSGESWASAATGAYDARWTQCLTNMASWRAGRTTFIRFAHEMNGTWYPWSVNSGNVAAFKTAWARFYALKQSIFPAAKLVFNVNYESTGGYAWPDMWPGDQYVDVLGVDYYNRAAVVVTSSADWTAKLNATATVGGTSEPRGLGAYRQYAQNHGKPLGMGEWAPDSAGGGDNAAFVTGFLTYCQSNAGPGSGQIVYEILFNQSDPNGPFQGNFGVWDQTKMTDAQTAYNAFF